MAKPPVSDHNTTSDDHLHLQTWILRVYIHCEGCKKKVHKILQRIDGVYKTVIDSKEHKVTVTGSVNGETLVQKLLKSGKHAEILPQSVKATQEKGSGNPKKKKQSNKQNDDVPTGEKPEHVDVEKKISEDAATDDGKDKEVAEPLDGASGDGKGNGNDNDNNGGKKKKNKKKKGGKTDNNTPPMEGDTALETNTVAIEKVGPNELNLDPPYHMVYATPYDTPPNYNNFYPTPAYGVSYSTSNPGIESSYYTPPMYGYAQSHPSVYYPPPPPPLHYRRSVFDDHDFESEGRLCTIM